MIWSKQRTALGDKLWEQASGPLLTWLFLADNGNQEGMGDLKINSDCSYSTIKKAGSFGGKIGTSRLRPLNENVGTALRLFEKPEATFL